MSSVSQTLEAPQTITSSMRKRVSYTRAFAGLFLRDLYVLRREIGTFLIRVCMNPLLFLFVFTYIMPHMSGGAAMNPTAQMAGVNGAANFSTVLLPGLMAVAIMFSGIAAVALPLAQEFGVTREIDDRVMCPLPVGAVAIEKIVFSAIQSMVAAGIVFPLAYYVPSTPVHAHVTSWWFLGTVLVLASLLAGALGLAIGTAVNPKQIGLIFGVVVMPITFLGCVYYPWAALGSIKWLQIAVLFNPIVYMSEGLRAALTPSLGHMNEAFILGMLSFFLALLTWVGLRGFRRRSLDSVIEMNGSALKDEGTVADVTNRAGLAKTRVLGMVFISASFAMAYYFIVKPVHEAQQTGQLEYSMRGIVLPPAILYLGIALIVGDFRDGQFRVTNAAGKRLLTRKGKYFVAGLCAVLVATLLAWHVYLKSIGFGGFF